MIEDEIVGWYHGINGHKFEQTQGDSGLQLVAQLEKNP